MITFEIGQTVQRIDRNGNVVERDIKTETDVEYHSDLQSKGFTYTIA